ncbi:MAG: alpha-mannosidase [Propionibacteriaceae bacterium]
MHDDRRLLEGRLSRFVNDHLSRAAYRDAAPLTLTRWDVPDEPVPFGEVVNQDFTSLSPGTAWGRPWSTMWIHVTGEVPAAWCDVAGTRPEIVVDLGFAGGPGFQAEGLAYRPDGTTIKAVSPFNNHVPIAPRQPIDFYLEAAANPDVAHTGYRSTPWGDKATAGDAPIYVLTQLELVLRDTTVAELAADIFVLSGLMNELPVDSSRRAEILVALQRAVDVADPDDLAGTVADARAELRDVLARPAYASAHHVVGVGHAHIDSAWLWPVRETIRKCARTFSNVIELADADPTFRFACSSAQQYAWMKDYYPELFARITEKVHAGQFVPVGGMWVESDTNMPGGEAMARQFVAGKSFFLDNFGVETEEVWLPDSFGYSAALPQIVRASGSKWFLTQKISWNQINTMPHHTFWWEGIDGSRVFTHFPPADTYNSTLSGAEMARAERQYREKGKGTTSLMLFGYGDGGGGPNRDMLAAAKRLESLEGSPTLDLDSPAGFFTRAQHEYPNAPVWSGEMYLELHRGTYTTQARTKQGNRRSEHLLREAELWSATAALRTAWTYPAAELQHLWELVLLQQFHDILPGSSIAWVHQDAERNYAAVAERAERVIADAVAALVGEGDQTLALNAAPHERSGVPALGAGPILPEDTDVGVAEIAGDSGIGYRFDNGRVAVVINSRGQLTSLVDAVTGREAIAPGELGNRLQLHRDIPNQWDAWDVDEHYRRTVTELDQVDDLRVETKPEEAAVVVTRSFGSSTVEQRIALAAGSPSVEITTCIDWHERQKLLKLGFGLDVHADRSASETQFGHVFRATHTNTSWDFARFEICAHRFLHVGEPGYGVAISNDSTYGHDVSRTTRDGGGTTTTVRQSLVRAPLYPDPQADQGRHVLRTTVRPGAGIAEAVQEGYRTNLPLRTVRGARGVDPLVTVSNSAVVVEAVKLAQDGSGDLVVRLYESHGGHARTTVTAAADVSSVHATDLLERPVADGFAADGPAIDLDLRPFQLMTLRFAR